MTTDNKFSRYFNNTIWAKRATKKPKQEFIKYFYTSYEQLIEQKKRKLINDFGSDNVTCVND